MTRRALSVRRASWLLGALAASFAIAPVTSACGDDDPVNGAVPAPFGLDARPLNATCKAPARLPDPEGIALVSAFDGVTLAEPTQLLFDPIDNSRVYVLERSGVVRVFANEADTKESTVVLDLRSEVNSEAQEAGLLGMAFDPDYELNHFIYLSYTGFGGGPVNLGSLIVRYETKDEGKTLDPATKTIVFGPLVQPFENHNGGHIVFGPDRMLYFGLGDGGDGGDPKGNGQNLDVLFGKLLRIDVRTLPYAIPPTNPFASGGGQKEIYAYGLRNPWRFQFDPESGDLWLGDVGEDTEEEVDKITLGGNYGWSIKEGKGCLEGKPCSGTGLIDPVVSYGHDQGLSIVGGFVYRGQALPKLMGHYIYGDTVTGALFGFLPSDPKPRLLNPGGPNPTVVSFAEDGDRELYLASLVNGKIYKIEPAAPAGSVAFPEKLSQTGCFDPADAKRPNAALIPYGVKSALWSDGAKKERFFAIPDGEKIEVGPDGDLDLPTGSVTVKTFYVADRRIETRLFVRHDDGAWGGYTYEWNDEQTDAVLLPGGKTKRVGDQEWSFPTRGECFRCHTESSGRTLGLELGQLNGDFVYPTGRLSNQIETLTHLDLFDKPAAASSSPRLPDPSGDGPVSERARSYLHANCSMCHRPGGVVPTGIDFRFSTPLANMRVCNVDPSSGTLGVANVKLLAPGDPSRSLISLRTHALDSNRMPPLATKILDPIGAPLLDEWIKLTSACP